MQAPSPATPWRVASVRALPAYRLHVIFQDGTEGTVDLAARITSPHAGIFARLATPALFAQAFVDCGAVTWPGEIDLAPDAMHRAVQETGIWILR